MFFYFSLAAILFIISLYCSAKEVRINTGTLGLGKTLCFIFVLFIIVLGGIRWETGTDWVSYYNYFNENNTYRQFSGNFEFFYSLLNYIIKRSIGSYTALLFILSFFVIFLTYKTINRIALYPCISFFLFFCNNIGGMFPTRQTLAVAIAITSIYYIQKKNKLAFILITLISAFFHYALLLWFLSYYIYHKEISSRIIVFLFLLSIGIGVFTPEILKFIINETLIRFNISGYISLRIQHYILSYSSDGSFSIIRMFFSIARRVIFIPFFLILKNKMSEKYIYTNGLINLYAFGNIILSLFIYGNFAPMTRMVTVFNFTEVLLLPVILNVIKDNNIKYIFLILLFIYGLMKLYFAVDIYYDLFIPYKTNLF